MSTRRKSKQTDARVGYIWGAMQCALKTTQGNRTKPSQGKRDENVRKTWYFLRKGQKMYEAINHFMPKMCKFWQSSVLREGFRFTWCLKKAPLLVVSVRQYRGVLFFSLFMKKKLFKGLPWDRRQLFRGLLRKNEWSHPYRTTCVSLDHLFWIGKMKTEFCSGWVTRRK